MTVSTGEPDQAESSIDELARARRLLQQAEAQKREALTRLAAGICHDVNNFLTPVLAYATMIKEDLPPGHPAIEFADEIIQAAEKSQEFMKLMQDIRAKGHISGGFDLNAAAASVVAGFQAGLPAGIQMSFHPDPAAAAASGDTGAIGRALRELLDNAVVAMPVGGTITVATACVQLDGETPMDNATAPAGRYLVLSVRDEGTGMTGDVRARMYDPYFSSKPNGQAKGLGLSLAAGLINKCNGFIRSTTALGAGTTFEIFLRPAPAD